MTHLCLTWCPLNPLKTLAWGAGLTFSHHSGCWLCPETLGCWREDPTMCLLLTVLGCFDILEPCRLSLERLPLPGKASSFLEIANCL